MRSIKAGRSEWDSNEMCESPSAFAGMTAGNAGTISASTAVMLSPVQISGLTSSSATASR